MNTKESPLSGQGSRADSNGENHFTNNSLQAQRQRLLGLLHEVGSATTIRIRRELDIMHPAGRVMELKRQGHNIETHWINDATEAGKSHRVARYLLRIEGGDHG